MNQGRVDFSAEIGESVGQRAITSGDADFALNALLIPTELLFAPTIAPEIARHQNGATHFSDIDVSKNQCAFLFQVWSQFEK